MSQIYEGKANPFVIKVLGEWPWCYIEFTPGGISPNSRKLENNNNNNNKILVYLHLNAWTCVGMLIGCRPCSCSFSTVLGGVHDG